MRKKYHQPKELLNDFRAYVKKHGGVRPSARVLGYSPSYISLIMNDLHPVPTAVAEHLGWNFTKSVPSKG